MALAPESPAPAHIARLDVMRALAFLSVYAFHFTGLLPHMHLPWQGDFLDYSRWPKRILFLLPVAFGWLGVTLFFVLSGFCIHFATLRRATPFRCGNFFWRRFLRIYPAYFVCVLFATALSFWIPTKYFNFWQVLAHLFMVHNLVKATFFGLAASFWSLAVEVQFYFLYPILLYLLKRSLTLSQCLVLALTLNLLFQILIGLTHASWNPVQTTWSFPLVTWCDWILGACLAEAYVQKRKLFQRENLWLIFSALVLLLALNFRMLNAQAYLFGSVFFTVVLQRYLRWTAPLFHMERALVPVGLVSYSLYLWHGPILHIVDTIGLNLHLFTSPAWHSVYVVVTATPVLALVAIPSYFLLERRLPALLKDYVATWQRRPARLAPL